MAKVREMRGKAPQNNVPPPQEVAIEDDQALVEAEAPAHTTTWGRIWAFLSGPYPTLLSRLVLGGILLIAGLSKVGAVGDMVTSIDNYQMPLPHGLVVGMAWVIPVVEILAGLMILVGLYTRIAAGVGGFLMLIFTVAIVQAWARGIQGDCGCFAQTTPGASPSFGSSLMQALGPVGRFLSDEKIGWQTTLRDSVFLLMAVHLILVPTIYALDNWRARRALEEEYEEE